MVQIALQFRDKETYIVLILYKERMGEKYIFKGPLTDRGDEWLDDVVLKWILNKDLSFGERDAERLFESISAQLP